MLAFFINGKIDWLGDLRANDPKYLNKIAKIKVGLMPEDICVDQASCILPFVKEVFNYEFLDEP